MKINEDRYNTIFLDGAPTVGKRTAQQDYIQLSDEDKAIIDLALQGMCVDLTIRAAVFMKRHYGES